MSLLDTASLVITPNGYKEGKLYSVVPSDGAGDLSVTRATTATRVNASGLVELVPYNLLQYSEQLDNSSVWAAFSGTTLTANTVTAPDGTLTADRIQGASGGFRGVRQSISLDTTTCTLSVYLKSATGANQNARIWIDTTSQVVALTTEWQRFTLTALPTTSTFDVTISTAIGASIDVYAWGAQLVEGSTAKDYQKTETRLNIPRLDYTNGTCPSILVEPQRTNLFQYSEQFDNAYWGKYQTSLTANSVVSPDGNTTADTVTVTTGTGGSLFLLSPLTGTYTVSIFMRAGTSSITQIEVAGVGNVDVNLSAGTFTTSGSVTGTIKSFGNGWYRCTATFTGTAVPYIAFGITGTTGQTIYLWGAQLEAGSYATSYIPTTSASVTRNADVISKTGISSLIGQTEGTLYFDGIVNNIQNANSNILNTNKSPNTISTIQLSKSKADNKFRFDLFLGNGTFTRIILNSSNTFVNGDRTKIAIRYKSGDFAMYINGNLEDTDLGTFTNNGTKSELFLNDAVTYFNFQESVSFNNVALWKTALTNTQLAQLTTI